jgi:hypothetical protein
MEKIDIGLIQFLWVAMGVPLAWLFILLNSLKKDLDETKKAIANNTKDTNDYLNALKNSINEAKERANSAQSKAENAINETRVREILKEEIGPISTDIKALTETINKAMREFDQKMFNLALDAAKSQTKVDKIE